MSQPLQLIDGDGKLQHDDALLLDTHSYGLNYHVVGVFGAQSSGKSTLMNAMFGTRFVTLPDTSVRSRTTQGAYLSTSTDDESLLLLDFEGTDGSERGDDSTFERQLCLFALSVADVLLLNMWSTDVGRFNAANLSLLRTVFEVRLQLSRHERHNPKRVTLLFVIRDHSGDVERAGAKIGADLRALWGGMQKPAEFGEMTMEDFFHIQFVALPHWEFQRPQFDAAVAALRGRFVEGGEAALLPKGMLHDVPLEALGRYMRTCWDTIRANEDLDLPTQRTMVAEYRCTAVGMSLVQSFERTVAEHASRITAESTVSVRAELAVVAKDLMANFDAAAQLYAPKVVAKHRETLQASLVRCSEVAVTRQVGLLAGVQMRSLEHLLNGAVDEANAILTDSQMHDVPPQRTAKATVDAFWAALVERGKGVHGRWAITLGTTGALADAELRSAVVEKVEREVRAFIRRIFEGAAADINGTMNRVFERMLKFDKKGEYRSFATERDLQRAVGPARYSGFVALACFQRWRLEDSWEIKALPYLSVPAACASDEGATPSENVAADDASLLISSASLPHIVALFRQHVQHAFELQRAVIQAGGRVPTWMWVLLLIFGYDELWYIITNPVLLVLLGTVLYMFFATAVAAAYRRLKTQAPPLLTGFIAIAENTVGGYLTPREKPKSD